MRFEENMTHVCLKMSKNYLYTVVYVGFADYGNYSVNEDGDFVHVCAKMEGVSQRREMLLLSSDDGTAKCKSPCPVRVSS